VKVTRLTPSLLQPYLERCGYTLDSRLVQNYQLDSTTVPLAGFFGKPFDTRSACLAIVEAGNDSRAAAQACVGLGAPTVLVCRDSVLDWWRLTIDGPTEVRQFPADQIDGLFHEHREELSPESVYAAKLRRPLPGSSRPRQLWFVDIGLMPATERRMGEALHHLVEGVIQDLAGALGERLRGKSEYEGLYKTVFWLLAAKLLHEKNVKGFKELDLFDVDEVFKRVGRHYKDLDDLPPGGKAWRRPIEAAAATVAQWGYLGNISTESLSYLYEKALIDKKPRGQNGKAIGKQDGRDIRKELGIHSTPPVLIDHMLSQLWPLVEQHALEDRHVFEPACGPAGFLVAAMRWLRDFSGLPDGEDRHRYLRSHLHGIEVEPFAREVAKLSLTLADVPYGNSWRIEKGDMFDPRMLTKAASQCKLLLANPPYETFSLAQRGAYAEAGQRVTAVTKAVEMLNRTLPALPSGAAFGVVLPWGVLHDKESRSIRDFLVNECELVEIDLFADNLFEEADHETAVLVGRRRTATGLNPVMYRRVREQGMSEFKDRLAFSSEQKVPQARFSTRDGAYLFLPELEEVWSYLGSYPKLESVADLGQGLSYKSKDLPRGAWTVHDPPKRGDNLGYCNVPDDMVIYEPPRTVGMNLERSVLARLRAGLPPGTPQVLFNYAPISRKSWRLKAVIDPKGLATSSRFINVRPKRAEPDVLVLWALLNSPVANAFAYTHSMKRQILVGTMRKMPIPATRADHFSRLRSAALTYLDLTNQLHGFMRLQPSEANIRSALLSLDAEVLKLYDLPPRLERQLLNLFERVERKGVGCKFTGYYPSDLRAFVPLHELISDVYSRSTAGSLRERHKPADSPEIISALRTASEAFTED
jgi:hypothetical protein